LAIRAYFYGAIFNFFLLGAYICYKFDKNIKSLLKLCRTFIILIKFLNIAFDTILMLKLFALLFFLDNYLLVHIYQLVSALIESLLLFFRFLRK
jgi:hypothetical protein